jgi:uncharacterized protein YkwD
MNGPVPESGARELGGLVNAERTARGLAPLQPASTLHAAAQAHADDMVANGYFSHAAPDGSTPLMRMRRAGFYACYAAENIAQGQLSASATVRSWMGSEGHRKNVLSPSPQTYGAGVADGPTWVMVYAREC